MDFRLTEEQELIRSQVRELARDFSDDYWREKEDKAEFPWEFSRAFAEAGWLGICIPQEYGGAELGLTEAVVLMEEVSASAGGVTAASVLHHSVFSLNPFIHYGTAAAKEKYLPAFPGERCTLPLQ